MPETRNQIIQDKMRNKGFYVINPQPMTDAPRTVVVLGCARSGTSMVAGALHKLGVSVGRRHDDATFEDIDLSNAFEKDNIVEAETIISEYNEQHNIWAWKRPALLNYFDKTQGKLRNPYYVAVFKDIFSIANRNRISMEVDVLHNMSSVIQDHLKLLEILKSLDTPCLMLSNEKVLQNKEEAVTALSDFVGTGSSQQRNDAIQFITPNRTTYLDSTRKNRNIGFIDKLTDDAIVGWAKSAFSPERVTVELLVNNVVTKSVLADAFREDLKQNHHGDGYYAYRLDLTGLAINPGDTIGVRVKGDIVELSNSPMIYQKP